jgi:predicted 2-oxoglutarate/Fe(II)-dependent dioxygenase YbiX/peroxiredoxin
MSWLRPGDLAPDFIAVASTRPDFHFYTVCGSYVVLCFFGSTSLEPAQRMLDGLLSQAQRFDDVQVRFFGVSVDSADATARQIHQRHGHAPGVRFFWDFDRRVSQLYGAADPPPAATYHLHALVLDPSLRVIASLPLRDGEDHAAQVWTILDALPEPGAYGAEWLGAPLLTVPNVFEPEFCAELIRRHERLGGLASGFMRERDGWTVGVHDARVKRRSDHLVDDETVQRAIRERIDRRLTPAIRHAFQFRATRIERYLIACYDAEQGGFFKPHRDDTTRATAHRRFAVTINLNADEYEGGDLRFPEFGARRYRAPTGGAIAFSCSLTHEALPVTKGRRYAFLPFLYDEAAQRLREENLRFLATDGPPGET